MNTKCTGYRISTNNLLGVPRNNYGDFSKKQANKNKEKLAILLSIGIIVVRKQG